MTNPDLEKVKEAHEKLKNAVKEYCNQVKDLEDFELKLSLIGIISKAENDCNKVYLRRKSQFLRQQ